MGSDCVQKLRGMFAFALYDERRRKLLIARDRFGKKPLHYALAGERVFFGSEMKAILAVAPGLAEVNNEAVPPYIYFRYGPGSLPAFFSIHKVPPGHILAFGGG